MKWPLIWALWTVLAGGSFAAPEWFALRDKTPGSFTLPEFGWRLIRNPAVNIFRI